MPNEFLQQKRIAYFSMEVALRSEIPTYAGGLGVLAGDTVRSAADLGLPLVTVTLASRAGYFKQTIDASGQQHEQPDPWDPGAVAKRLDARVCVTIEEQPVWVGGFLFVVQSHLGGRQPVVLLDTDLAENRAEDRTLTHFLSGGDHAYRLKQEIILGIGGTRLLHALGFRIQDYHMNEGHAALLTLELLRRNAYPAEEVRPGEPLYDVPRVREQCNFTTHTPVEAGHDRFPYELVDRLLDDFVDRDTVRKYGGADELNLTRLALNLSDRINGVAKSHAATSRAMFPGYQVMAITNGVHPWTWTSPPFARLYDRYLPGWCHEPENLVRADCCIPAQDIWQAHQDAKSSLLDEVHQRTGVTLDQSLPIFGYARRMTAYKRPELVFTDLDALRSIAKSSPFQLVIAGKAHPQDVDGKEVIRRIHQDITVLAGDVPVVFLPNYDMALAKKLVAGCDVWLNTPLPPMEASGTSGMKAAFNGVPNLSVLDGWWAEACIEGITGWAVGSRDPNDHHERDASVLYQKMRDVVLPMYFGERSKWIAVMQGAIAKNASLFNSHRMMRRYASDAYLR